MLIDQQVRVAGDRGPLKDRLGIIEQILYVNGSTDFMVRMEHPYNDVLYAFKAYEIARTSAKPVR